MKQVLNIFWFRRDLRLEDNHGLFRALEAGIPVLPVFIFDTNILEKLPRNDARVTFLYDRITTLKNKLQQHGSDLRVLYGDPSEIWKSLLDQYSVKAVFANHDYEPYARERDEQIQQLLQKKSADFLTFKDQVIFEKSEVVKDDGKNYTVFTPYSKKWKARLTPADLAPFDTAAHFGSLWKIDPESMMSLADMNFEPSDIEIPLADVSVDILRHYDETRDIPSLANGTSRLGIHLRFGTISIRVLVAKAKETNQIFLSELIWREFFQQILWQFPHVVQGAFRPQYDDIQWENSAENFQAWCEGKTGYPLVDAGMRELNATGYMHNRVRMVTASFLCKHLLIDWRWGEKYFAEKLLDFDLAANNGGWQWSAGTGCDASPYFRVFNPTSQQKKFDPAFTYIRRWVPEYGTPAYPAPIVEHSFARNRALERYKVGLGKK